MNLEKLRQAEADFLQVYPGGFADPAMQAIKKKHNVNKLVAFASENLTRLNCNRPEFIAESLLKIISRSSMVSRFEKPPFRTFLESLDSADKKALAYAVEQRLFGRKQQGFEALLAMHQHFKIAKWAIISAVPFYVSARREVFVKPTTAKGILALLEVDNLHYSATPSWEFYKGYQSLIGEIKKHISPSLAPNNAALTGFLMMSLRRDSANTAHEEAC
ncbi:MAG: hypothetical protein ACI8W7_000371 [Gammaproteobacteria bacterium]|jgi:hypothetical protein